jgi:hypothetical protein
MPLIDLNEDVCLKNYLCRCLFGCDGRSACLIVIVLLLFIYCYLVVSLFVLFVYQVKPILMASSREVSLIDSISLLDNLLH